MKWKVTLALALMPWFVVVCLSYLPTGQSLETTIWTVAFMFGMVLWPLSVMLVSIFWSLESNAKMAEAESYLAMTRARYGGARHTSQGTQPPAA